MRKKRNEKALRIAAAAAAVVLVAGAITGGIAWLASRGGGEADDGVTPPGYVADEAEDPSRHPYINDVNYQGPFDYMEAYDHPFQKSDNYRMNKELASGTEEAAEEARGFISELFTRDYRDVAADPGATGKLIAEHADGGGLFFVEAGDVTGDYDTAEDWAEALADWYVENGLSTEAEFKTNASLVYEDLYVYCRGVLELKSYGDDGGERRIPMEAVMKQDEGGFQVVGLVPVEGWGEFAEAGDA